MECVSDLAESYSLVWLVACCLVNWGSAGALGRVTGPVTVNQNLVGPARWVCKDRWGEMERIRMGTESLSARILLLPNQPVHSGWFLVCTPHNSVKRCSNAWSHLFHGLFHMVWHRAVMSLSFHLLMSETLTTFYISYISSKRDQLFCYILD